MTDKMLGPNEIRKFLEDYAERMTDREKKVIKLRFGVEDGVVRTLDEVAQIFGVARERIRQIESKAFRKWHPHRVRSKKLKEYLED